MTEIDRDMAWRTVEEALPAGWRIGPPTYDPGSHAWSVSAIDLRTTGRGKIPRSVTGTGDDVVAALLDLDDRLRGVPKPDGTQMDELRRRARLAYVAGAVGRWPDITADELARVIERAPILARES